MEFLILFFGSACIFFTLDGLLFALGIRYLSGPRDYIMLVPLPPAQRKAIFEQVIRSTCRRDKRLMIPGVILSLFWACCAILHYCIGPPSSIQTLALPPVCLITGCLIARRVERRLLRPHVEKWIENMNFASSEPTGSLG